MKYFEFYNPVKICAGENAINHLKFELYSYNIKKPMILSGKSIVKLGTLNKILNIAEIENYFLFTDIPIDSSTKVVNQILELFKENNCDGLLAIGGGSVIDTAKGVKMAYNRTSDLKQIMGLESVAKADELPLIVLPTTSGTGSEVTNVAVIKDKDNNVKMEFITPYLMPNVAIIDPILTLTLPPKITASTGMDALTHSIEGYSCLQKNPISDAYALSAIKLIFDNLELVCRDSSNIEARTNMAVAANLAGLCFGNSMVGSVHAIGHSLGGICNISHGDAMAILLPYVMEFNKQKVGSLYAEIASVIFPNECSNLNENKKCDLLILKITELKKKLNVLTGMPISLTQCNGYDKIKKYEIALGTLNDGAIIVNPVAMDVNDIKNILDKAE